ncbi:MAG: IS110 family transposase, partial [Chloroflexi bacterium]
MLPSPRTWGDAQAAAAKLAGLWWPRNQSGNRDSQERHMPKAANPYLRYYLVEAAQHVRDHLAEYDQFYQQKYRETQKHKHRRALVLTARK